ncbi:hypothetical protein [Hyphomonas oceanitis]|uniref:hypothetical protein n=1 Tax=Hyphomonas oceanitis TaxID=81033 RepID=UPI0030027498
MSLLTPPDYVPAHLVPIWPWIWLQHQVLLAWIRLTYGRGYRYCWGATHSGRVFLISIDLESRDRAHVRPLAAHASPQLAAALSGEDPVPAYVQFMSDRPQPRAALARLPRHPAVQATALPLPDS